MAKIVEILVNSIVADALVTSGAVASMAMVLTYPDSKVRGANMGPILGRQDPDGPHVGPMDLVFWVVLLE